MSRYNGFTCPKCGSHYFGTMMYHEKMGNEWPHNAQIGHCNAHSHIGNGCTYKWNRADNIAEDEAIYEQTAEEWEADFEKTKETLRQAVIQ